MCVCVCVCVCVCRPEYTGRPYICSHVYMCTHCTLWHHMVTAALWPEITQELFCRTFEHRDRLGSVMPVILYSGGHMHCWQADVTMPPRKLIFHQINDGSGQAMHVAVWLFLRRPKMTIYGSFPHWRNGWNSKWPSGNPTSYSEWPGLLFAHSISSFYKWIQVKSIR
jgi:hypothetical protein